MEKVKMTQIEFDAIPKRIIETHGENREAKEYLAMCDLIELRYKV